MTVLQLCSYIANTHSLVAPIILTRRARNLRKETGNDQLYSAHELVLREKSIPAAIRGNSTKVIELLILEPMLMLLAFWSALLLGILYLLLAVFRKSLALQSCQTSSSRSRPSPSHRLYRASRLQDLANRLGIYGHASGHANRTSDCAILLKKISQHSRDPGWTSSSRGSLTHGHGWLHLDSVSALTSHAKVTALTLTFPRSVSLFWFAYTTDASVHWVSASAWSVSHSISSLYPPQVVPILASMPFGAASILIYTAIVSFITDAWRPVVASAVGTNVLLRSLFSAFFPLFSNQLYRALGTVGATSLLAGLNVLMVPIPFLLYKHGAKLRAQSRFTY